MKKTPHYWAYTLTHERISYGDILKDNPALLRMLKKAIFEAAREVITEALAEAKKPDAP